MDDDRLRAVPVHRHLGDDARLRSSLRALLLRDPVRLCGRCEYRERCGGSRARAFALTGDPLGEDPGCVWEPRGAPAVPAIAGASDAPQAVTSDQVLEALRGVLDPELGMSVVDLGLIYGIDVHADKVAVTMTLTAAGCPIHDAMTEWVQRAVMKIPGVSEVEVAITFDPPWTPERITPAPAPSH